MSDTDIAIKKTEQRKGTENVYDGRNTLGLKKSSDSQIVLGGGRVKGDENLSPSVT